LRAPARLPRLLRWRGRVDLVNEVGRVEVAKADPEQIPGGPFVHLPGGSRREPGTVGTPPNSRSFCRPVPERDGVLPRAGREVGQPAVQSSVGHTGGELRGPIPAYGGQHRDSRREKLQCGPDRERSPGDNETGSGRMRTRRNWTAIEPTESNGLERAGREELEPRHRPPPAPRMEGEEPESSPPARAVTNSLRNPPVRARVHPGCGREASEILFRSMPSQRCRPQAPEVTP
jgi:hypothetical protein